MSEYNAVTAVWEITMACNMRCMHCGSACSGALPDELTTKEALDLCDDLGKLGLKWITLSGGEPLTRKDWPLIAERLRSNGIIPNLITNGWLMDDSIVRKMKESGIGTVAISLDGTKETHDLIRKEGSFERNIRAFGMLKENGQYCGAITSINKNNLNELEDIKNQLVKSGVNSWQLQICIPMGNMVNHKDELIDPEDIDKILDFCLEVAKSKEIVIYPADCIGYYTQKEELIRSISFGSGTVSPWSGCNAGTRGFGILQNGDILGCTSIRDKSFIEGNIRQRNIVEIWNDKNSFAWSRSMTKNKLGGNCRTCHYGDVCLGGCPNTRLTMNGSINSENPYCVYKVAMDGLKGKLENNDDSQYLFKKARDFAINKSFQESAIILEHLLKKDGYNEEILSLLGYTHFFMANYDEAKKANETILAINPENSYANKGLGLSLHRLGETEKGISYIQKAIDNSPQEYKDPYYDLAAVYNEIGEYSKAQEVLSKLYN